MQLRNLKIVNAFVCISYSQITAEKQTKCPDISVNDTICKYYAYTQKSYGLSHNVKMKKK